MHWLLVSTHWLCTRQQFNPRFESISSSMNYFHTHNGPFVELERGMLSLMGVANASKSLSMASPSRMQMTLSAQTAARFTKVMHWLHLGWQQTNRYVEQGKFVTGYDARRRPRERANSSKPFAVDQRT